jgi:hypothetical protein
MTATPAATATGPWPVELPQGAATGIGSLPGTDPATAQQLVFDLLPDLPHLVELPDRGPGADMIGRTAALLTDLAVDLQPAGWRFVPHPGREHTRAQDMLARDLDALAAVADGWTGPLKIQAAGPWTLAATIELHRGDKALADPAAVADIAASLADGLAVHLAAVRRAVPGAHVFAQLDEPSLPAVVAGHVRTASGFSILRTPETPELQAMLATALAATPHAGVHCCASDVPVELLRHAGASWISLDATLLGLRHEDALGEALEAGTGLILGIDGDPAPALTLFRRLGVNPTTWLSAVVLSPRCGITDRPEPIYQALTKAGRRLAEEVGA